MARKPERGGGRGASPDRFRTYNVKPMQCPTCGDVMDRASTLEDIDRGKSPPVAGDVTLCFNCGEVLVIDPEEKCHVPTILEMMDWPQPLRIAVLEIQGVLKRRGRIRN